LAPDAGKKRPTDLPGRVREYQLDRVIRQSVSLDLTKIGGNRLRVCGCLFAFYGRHADRCWLNEV
jgi:hypothetical protein